MVGMDTTKSFNPNILLKCKNIIAGGAIAEFGDCQSI